MRCKLSDVCSFRKGKIKVDELDNKTYVSTENMLSNKAGIMDAASLPATPLTQAYKTGDVLVSNIRPYFKKIWRAKHNGGCSNDVLVFEANENIEKDFLYYLLADDAFFAYAAATSKGTKMPRGDKASIMQYEIPVFDRHTQSKIASVLRAIDDKIETNQAINDNLEQQISSIYANLCENKSWDSCELGSLVEVRDGTHDSPKPQSDGYLLVTSKHLLPYGVDRITPNRIAEKDFKKINERSLVETGDVLMSMIGTIGLISFVADQTIDYAIKNVALFKTSKTPELAYYFLTFLKSKKTQQYIEMCLAGSTQKYISLGELRKMPIPNPEDETLEHFNEIVRPMYQTIILNTQENNAFTELRASLLPKLISGDLDVSEIDI